MKSICPKCGGGYIRGPVYMEELDVLRYRCAQCGYTEDKEPLDSKRYEDVSSIARQAGKD